MAKAYSIDLRRRVIDYIKAGHSKADAARRYALSWRSVLRWSAASNLEPLSNRVRRAKKLDGEKVREYIGKYPDATLKEIGEHFKASAVAVFKRVRSLGLTYKKKSFYTKSVTKKSERSSLLR
jgi:transposase